MCAIANRLKPVRNGVFFLYERGQLWYNTKKAKGENIMISDMMPFRLAGNIYYIGCRKESSHLIDTGEGLILIDTGSDDKVDALVESIGILGFRVEDIKLILHSHGHYDHSGASGKLAQMSGAKTYVHEKDVRYLFGKFQPDHGYCDGDVIRLGNTEILCLETPGHTEGTVSFFLWVEENGKRYRAGMFGGAGINQIKIKFLKQYGLSYFQRAQYLQSLARLRKEPVDIFLGNHSWNNKTPEKYQLSLTSNENPFIDSTGWGEFLDRCEAQLMDTMVQESKDGFINFAHRGASEYAPENTMMAFSLGMYMGANGIETDVQLTKDGVPVLFHDDSLERVTGESGAVSDYTYEQLRQFHVMKGELSDKILKLEDFLIHFGFRDITFAIELKTAEAAEATVELIRKYAMEKKVTVTSFKYDAIQKVRAIAPELKTGLLTSRVDDALLEQMRADGIDELCPRADLVTEEAVTQWHRMGFHVRAWGVKNEEVMQAVYDACANGMTVNFPDKLQAYISK